MVGIHGPRMIKAGPRHLPLRRPQPVKLLKVKWDQAHAVLARPDGTSEQRRRARRTINVLVKSWPKIPLMKRGLQIDKLPRQYRRKVKR